MTAFVLQGHTWFTALRTVLVDDISWINSCGDWTNCSASRAYINDHQMHDGLGHQVSYSLVDDAHVRVHQVSDGLHLPLQLRIHGVHETVRPVLVSSVALQTTTDTITQTRKTAMQKIHNSKCYSKLVPFPSPEWRHGKQRERKRKAFWGASFLFIHTYSHLIDLNTHHHALRIDAGTQERRFPSVHVLLTLAGQLQLTVVLIHVPVTALDALD